MLSSQSSPSSSPSPVFSSLCVLSASAFSSLSRFCIGKSSAPRFSQTRPLHLPSSGSFCGSFPNLQTFQHSNLPTFLPTIPFRIIFFAHRHHLSPIESYSYKKQGRGWGFRFATFKPKPFHLFPRPVNIQHMATPATPLLSCIYFTLPVTPRVGAHPSNRNSSLARLAPQLTTATHYSPLLTFSSTETNSVQRAGNQQWLPTRDTAAATARGLSLWSVSKC
jgi:hypothetical protein